jgi:hypothetical protein
MKVDPPRVEVDLENVGSEELPNEKGSPPSYRLQGRTVIFSPQRRRSTDSSGCLCGSMCCIHGSSWH